MSHLSVSTGDLADGKAVNAAVRNAEAARAVSDTAFAAQGQHWRRGGTRCATA